MRIPYIFSVLCTMTLYSAQEKPIILWDLHGVLFHQKSYISKLLTYPPILKTISNIEWPFIKDLFKIGINNIEYLPIAEQYHNPYLQDFLEQAANNVTLIKAMQDLVFELAHLGYVQEIASNISPYAFAHLTNPQLYPQYASFFAVFNLRASQTGFMRDGIVIKKPNPAYYKEYLHKNNINLVQQPVIFIDDLKKNVLAARAIGFDAILFKHPYQLRMALRSRGIPIAPPAYTFSDQHQSYIHFALPRIHTKY